MKLTFWLVEQQDDHPCYNIVARTKKGALVQMKHLEHHAWEEPKKVTLEYRDAFDLFEKVTCEGGGRTT